MYPNIEHNDASVTVNVASGAKFILCKDPDGSYAVCVCVGSEAIRVAIDHDDAEQFIFRLNKLI